jgi:outer membrane scaffolding protein for murein synthesis (MipA/OmpV family)
LILISYNEYEAEAKMKIFIGTLLLCSFNLLAATPTIKSQQLKSPNKKNVWNITVGAAGISSSSPYKHADTTSNLFPLVTAIKGKFSFEADRFKYKNLKQDGLSGFTYLKFDFAPFASNDSLVLKGMDKKRAGAGLGQVLSITKGPLSYGLNTSAVVGLPTHGIGAIVYTKFSQRPLNAFGNLLILKYSLSLNYMDAQRSNYRYGVKGSEEDASLGREEYKLKDTIGSAIGLESIYLMGPTKKWVLVNNVSASFLDSNIRNSPIVSDATNFLYIFGLGYKL